MLQFKETFLGTTKLFGERSLIVNNILIKYTNANKINFDVYLNENGLLKYDRENIDFNRYHPDNIIYFIKNEKWI